MRPDTYIPKIPEVTASIPKSLVLFFIDISRRIAHNIKVRLKNSAITHRRQTMNVGVKEQVIKLVETLPDEVTIDDIMEELYFKIQVDEGLIQLDEGKGIPHKEVESRLSQWLS